LSRSGDQSQDDDDKSDSSDSSDEGGPLSLYALKEQGVEADFPPFRTKFNRRSHLGQRSVRAEEAYHRDSDR